jgi:hypothetical protein
MPKNRNRRSCRPNVEALDGRLLLTAGPAPLSYLLTPIPETATLAEHIHPHLAIVIDGQHIRIPGEIGIGPDGADPIHTHDSSGLLHVEASVAYDFTLDDFFTTWGKDFSAQDVLGHRADATHKIEMTVDGKPSQAFGSLVLKDHQHIVIREVKLPAHRAATHGRTRWH